MIKRLLRRASSLNPGESDDFADEQPTEASAPVVPVAAADISAALEAKLERMTLQLSQMALQLNQTQSQLRQLQQAARKTETALVSGAGRSTDELNGFEIRVNASLAAHQERLKIHTNMTNESLQRVISGSEQMATRLSKTEKAIQNLKNSTNNCSCVRSVGHHASSSRNEGSDDSMTGAASQRSEDFQKFQWDIEREVEQLKMKLQLTASDLEKSINAIQINSDGALRNFSAVYQEGMKSLANVLEDKVSVASTSSYDVITNATLAFGEDLQVLRQAVSSSAAQIQFLVAQDMKTVRGLEEMRSGSRRHESNIQLLTTQLGDFKLQVQDQLNNVRTHFSQAVTEYYQKIAERQSAMSYRLTSIIDELANVKGKGNWFIICISNGSSIEYRAAWLPSRSFSPTW